MLHYNFNNAQLSFKHVETCLHNQRLQSLIFRYSYKKQTIWSKKYICKVALICESFKTVNPLKP